MQCIVEVVQPTTLNMVHSPQRDPSAFESFISGSASGCAGVLVCHPFDVIRTRVQTNNLQKGTVECLRDILKESGPRGLYTGLLGPFFAQGIYKAVIFTTNSMVNKHVFTGQKTKTSVFLSGAIAGTLNSVIVAPIELLRTRQILSATQQTYSAVFRTLLSEAGILGLFRGLLPAILRDGPGVGAYFLTFDVSKRYFTNWLSPHVDPRHQNTIVNSYSPIMIKLLSGSCAGVAFWILALPIDAVKTLFETSPNVSKVGFLDQFSDIYDTINQRGGIRSLFRSWPVAIGRGIPSAAVTLTTYDFVLEHLATNALTSP